MKPCHSYHMERVAVKGAQPKGRRTRGRPRWRTLVSEWIGFVTSVEHGIWPGNGAFTLGPGF